MLYIDYDRDMIDIVKLHAVEQTFKNPEFVRPDFTIHGVEYFSELLVDSDTKVE